MIFCYFFINKTKIYRNNWPLKKLFINSKGYRQSSFSTVHINVLHYSTPINTIKCTVCTVCF